jgi:hypothetical protein
VLVIAWVATGNPISGVGSAFIAWFLTGFLP